MKIELYLPYYPEGAVAGSQDDLSDEEYAEQLKEMFNGEYNSFMNGSVGLSNDSRYGMTNIIPDKYGIKSVEDKRSAMYYGFECILNDENDKNMSYDEFMFYANSSEMCAFFVHMLINDEYRNTDAINELNFWLKESREIMSNPHIDDDHRLMMLPYKDLIIKIPEVDNIVIPGKFKVCGSRVIDQDNNSNFAIIVTKIERSK